MIIHPEHEHFVEEIPASLNIVLPGRHPRATAVARGGLHQKKRGGVQNRVTHLKPQCCRDH